MDEMYAQAIERWRAARAARLRSPTGWLTFVDRLVLDEGDNELPFGTLALQGGVARLRRQAEAVVTLGGEPLPIERVWRADESGPPEALVYEGKTYELFRRGEAFAVRVKDPASPALRAFAGLEYFPLDPSWRIRARFEAYDPPHHTVHEYEIGGGWRRTVPGVARFERDGHKCALEPVLEEDSQRLFFIFWDETSRTESYPSGRFLYADRPVDGEVVLDFNTAFNPPCAFTPFVSCPLTPPQHRLPLRIAAGEKRYHQNGTPADSTPSSATSAGPTPSP